MTASEIMPHSDGKSHTLPRKRKGEYWVIKKKKRFTIAKNKENIHNWFNEWNWAEANIIHRYFKNE